MQNSDIKYKFNLSGNHAYCEDCKWETWNHTAHEESVLHAVEKYHRVSGGYVTIYEYNGKESSDDELPSTLKPPKKWFRR